MINFKRIFNLSSLSILCIGLLLGCKTSSGIKTSEMDASVIFTSIDDSSEVEVSIRKSADNVSLSVGDSLYADVNGVRQELHRRNVFSTRYYTNFTFNSENQTLRLSLVRPDNVDAPNSTVTMPARFNVNTPNPDDIYLSGEDITVTWAPASSGTSARVSFDGTCTRLTAGPTEVNFNITYPLPDNGSFTTSVFSILNSGGMYDVMNPDINCPVRINVERIQTGQLDANYKNGSIIAKQITYVDVFFDP